MAGILGPPSVLPQPLSLSPPSVVPTSLASLISPAHSMAPSSSPSSNLSCPQIPVDCPQSFDPSGGMLLAFNSTTFPPLLASQSASVSSQLSHSSDSKLSYLLAIHGILPDRSKSYIEDAELPLFLEQGSREKRVVSQFVQKVP
ncbi:hypothetical protein Nepgr_023252 [Nepenthes gracilis]|uniref:Uncharacterized protein n=1 Tax=Nepenthes gracilis TaxID=150966 RepID=A0AAD3T0W9_NEPGR|nr:hypothetical protein Nepgr_023252 [Nepenthes gracilis]